MLKISCDIFSNISGNYARIIENGPYLCRRYLVSIVRCRSDHVGVKHLCKFYQICAVQSPNQHAILSFTSAFCDSLLSRTNKSFTSSDHFALSSIMRAGQTTCVTGVGKPRLTASLDFTAETAADLIYACTYSCNCDGLTKMFSSNKKTPPAALWGTRKEKTVRPGSEHFE